MPERCSAPFYHGPGHQSKSLCELTGEHDVHQTHYRNGLARWRDGDYTNGLREKGIEFDPVSYPENMGMSGYFDEPPDE